jgi:2-polyprenyl-6-methoxyphenol hydroxylase-like FAD-dependent oxidoreductase
MRYQQDDRQQSMDLNTGLRRGGHAVVIGGSIAGLLTARVLTNYFESITVIERDQFSDKPEWRKGAPQARHAHGLLVRGQQIMEFYFPGLIQELWAQGAIAMNMGSNLSLYLGGAPVQPFASDLVVTMCSRPLLEYTIYRRLRAMPQVEFRGGYDVVQLRTDASHTQITGVDLRARGNEAGAITALAADLVVDASGRGSKLPAWLQALGFEPPAETVVDGRAGYATRLFRDPHQSLASTLAGKALYAMPQAPDQSRGCIVMALEGDRWQVTLTGLNGDHPPSDEEGFMAFARSIPVPGLYRALAGAEPISEPYGFRGAANRLRHYESLPRYLEGLIAVGDAVYALNPVYGQGMTVAALGALNLDECLRRQVLRGGDFDITGLARRFQRRLAKVNAGPWQMATGQDVRWPGVAAEQKRDPITRLIQHYFDRVLVTMTHNGEVAAAFAQVQNMLKSPAILFHPRIVWAVLRGSRATPHALSGPGPKATAPMAQ